MKTSKPQASSLRLLAWMPAALVFCCGLLPASVMADDHNKYHASDYQYWKQPGTNASCCNDSDCTPVPAEFRNNQWFAKRDGEWIPIPWERIIRERNPRPEAGHLCYTYGRVLCFVPPHIGQ
jgi:hypothetical protein